MLESKLTVAEIEEVAARVKAFVMPPKPNPTVVPHPVFSPELWSKSTVKSYKSQLHTSNLVLKNKVENMMQPCILLIAANRFAARAFIKSVITWANESKLLLPEIRVVTNTEQVSGKLIQGYVLLESNMDPKRQREIARTAYLVSNGEAKKYGTPEEFRRAVMDYNVKRQASQAAVTGSPVLKSPAGVYYSGS